MLPLHVEFPITLKDCRTAVYFGTTLRHRRAIQVFFVIIAAIAVYSAGGYFGLWPFFQFPLFLQFELSFYRFGFSYQSTAENP